MNISQSFFKFGVLPTTRHGVLVIAPGFEGKDPKFNIVGVRQEGHLEFVIE